ncbi:hypothetical protein [Paracidovorax avenae]|uniref:hypothetical protein n=1 Tax=Paracidovorax avenae TaxID=80867 RepID=UPI0012FE4062|nr:hypothetical protein [Paracidovorax avenae]
MDGFDFFVDNFVEKEHRERWHFFRAKGWARVRKNLGQLENQLDRKKTILIQKNTIDFAAQKIREFNFSSGKYIDFRVEELILPPPFLDKVSSNSLLVFEKEKIAFYFHDEGWIYYCR